MKKAVIDNITRPQQPKSFLKHKNMWGVFLWSEKRFYFSSELKAKQFLSYVAELTNFKIFEINEIYTDLIILYRQNWLLYETTRTNDSTLKFLENKTKVDIFDISNSLDRCFNRYGENQNPFVFNFIFQTLGQLIELSNKLKQFCELKKNVLHSNKINSIIVKVNSIENELKSISEQTFLDFQLQKMQLQKF